MSNVRARRRRARARPPHQGQGQPRQIVGDTHFEASPPPSVTRNFEASRTPRCLISPVSERRSDASHPARDGGGIVSPQSVREYLTSPRHRYLTAARREKSRWLTEAQRLTGHHRRSLFRFLHQPPSGGRRRAVGPGRGPR